MDDHDVVSVSSIPRFVVFVGLAAFVAACPNTRTTTKPGDAAGAHGDGSAPSARSPQEDALTLDQICAHVPNAQASSLPGKQPFTDLDPHCSATDPFCDSVDKTPDPKRTCFVANDNIARAANESRSAKGPLANTSAAWDGVAKPKFLDRIDAHLHLTPKEHEKLRANHFVVLDRLAYANYANAFHDIYQEQLPLFVGVDPILHAVFRGTELALERIEKKTLMPALATLLKKLRGSLVANPPSAEIRKDLDIYLSVAQALLTPSMEEGKRLSAFKDGDEETIKSLVDDASHPSSAGLKEVELFGRPRMIDFSQFEPRGHYSGSPVFAEGQLRMPDYFAAMMWLSRTELNLVSRDSKSSHPGPALDPTDTPREVADALALAEIVGRSGGATELRLFDEMYTAFAGKREDVSPLKLAEIARAKGIRSTDRDATAKLKDAIGNDFTRTAKTHFTLEGTKSLPAISTMFGPRIVPDVAPLTRLVHDEVPGRTSLGAADVAHVLGHDRAGKYIPDLGKNAALDPALARARAELRKNATSSTDIYGAWLRSILALSEKPSGVVPSFTSTPAWSDHRLSSALVGYGQIRHTFVLLAAQGYDSYGCEIPDAYVEPAPAVFDGLLAHVRQMRSKVGGANWQGLEKTLTTLAAIVHDEVSGRVLSEPQKRWLSMVAEFIPNGGYASTSEPPKWTGWYFDMFEDREIGASGSTKFIADYFTLTNEGQVAYLGAEGPRLGIYIVDTNGEPRAMVGPAAKGFEAHAPIAGRLEDEKVFDPSVTKMAPWRESYAVEEAPPPLGLEGMVVRCGDVVVEDDPAVKFGMGMQRPSAAPSSDAPPKPVEWRVAVRSTRAVAGPTSITLLDHHADPLTNKLTIDVDKDWKVGVFAMPPALARNHFGVEAVHVRVEDLSRSRTGTGPFDYATSPSVYRGQYDSPGEMPERPRGPSAFTIGGLPPPPVVDAGAAPP